MTTSESEHIEWKAAWRDDHLRWVCGFANTFFRAGEIEAWGRGIQRIFQACRDAGTPEPRLRHQANDLWLEFPFAPDYLSALESGDSRARLDEKLDEKFGKTRATILRLMKQTPTITVTDLGKRLSISRNAVDKNIQILKRDGWVKRIGPAKGGRWKVLIDRQTQRHPAPAKTAKQKE